jgi:hypothetical protein
MKNLPQNFFDPKKYVGTQDVKELATELVKRQGYVVIGYPKLDKHARVGIRVVYLWQFFVERVYEAVATATEQDWNMQTELIAHLRPAWTRLPSQRGMMFFKMKPV